MEKKYLRKVDIRNELQNALDNHEIYLMYQPQIGKNNITSGVEALVRWKNKKLGNVSPIEFITIAEDDGIICQIGDFIIAKALEDIASIQARTSQQFRLSLNVSVRQLLRIDFLDTLLSHIKRSGINPNLITIEITENLFIENPDYILPILNAIRAQGISISLDDFGTGYSSLSIVRKLPINELKIDKSFIDEINTDKRDRKMVDNFIAIAKNLDCSTVAEGVESSDQAETLQKMGCDYIQGYLYSKPLLPAQLEAFLKK